MPFELIPVPADEADYLLPILRDAEEGEERIWDALYDPDCVAYAARVDGELVGVVVVGWQYREGWTSQILYIAVVAEQRGKGYGKLILAQLQAELRARGLSVLLVG